MTVTTSNVRELAKVLVRTLRDPEFAEGLIFGDEALLEEYSLNDVDRAALTTPVESWDAQIPQGVPALRAWEVVSSRIDELDSAQRQELNDAIAHHASEVISFVPHNIG